MRWITFAPMQTIVTVIPAGDVIGAEVRCGDVRSLSDDAFRAVYRALLDHLVILVRGQTLTDPELIAFGRRIGELDFAPLAKTGKEKARAHPEIIVVSNVLENGVPIWDNRCAMHYRNPFDGGHRRVMHRIQCAGDRPARQPSARSGPHPRAAALAQAAQ